jgi:hypothetical protein
MGQYMVGHRLLVDEVFKIEMPRLLSAFSESRSMRIAEKILVRRSVTARKMWVTINSPSILILR